MTPALLTALLCLAATAPSRAEQLFNDGTAAYEQGEYEAALADFTRSYRSSQLPEVLFDIAQCERQLGRWRDAEGHYRRYLAAVPHAPNREQVDGYLEEVRARAAGEVPLAPAPAASVTAPRLQTPVTFPNRIWATGGVGVGLLVVGGILYGVGKGIAGRDVVTDCGGELCHSLTAGQASTANGLGYAGETGLAVGTATLVVAVVWAIADAGRRTPRRAP